MSHSQGDEPVRNRRRRAANTDFTHYKTSLEDHNETKNERPGPGRPLRSGSEPQIRGQKRKIQK